MSWHAWAQPQDLPGKGGALYHITCKEGVIQDSSPDLVSPAGASLSFLPVCVSFTADMQAPPSQLG